MEVKEVYRKYRIISHVVVQEHMSSSYALLMSDCVLIGWLDDQRIMLGVHLKSKDVVNRCGSKI